MRAKLVTAHHRVKAVIQATNPIKAIAFKAKIPTKVTE